MRPHTGMYRHRKRVCTESWLWEKNPLPHWRIEPASAMCRPDALPNELHPRPQGHGLSNWTTSPSPGICYWCRPDALPTELYPRPQGYDTDAGPTLYQLSYIPVPRDMILAPVRRSANWAISPSPGIRYWRRSDALPTELYPRPQGYDTGATGHFCIRNFATSSAATKRQAAWSLKSWFCRC